MSDWKQNGSNKMFNVIIGDYEIRCAQTGKKSWWWAIYQYGNIIISSDDDKKYKSDTKSGAMKISEDVFLEYVKAGKYCINPDNIITEKSLKNMIGVSDKRTMSSYIKGGILPSPVNMDGESVFDRNMIAKILGIKHLPDEPFIGPEETCKIMGISDIKLLNHYVRSGKIPSYRLKNARGQKYLFLRSEIEAHMRHKLEFNSSYASFISGQFFFKTIIQEVITLNITKDISERESIVIKEVVFNKKNFDILAEEMDLTRERVRQLFNSGCKKILYRLKLIPSQISALEKMAMEPVAGKDLIEENKRLREIIKSNNITSGGAPDVLNCKLDDIEISPRLYNILKIIDVFTLGDLIKYSKSDLRKCRNFGDACVKEVESIVSKYKLKLKSDIFKI